MFFVYILYCPETRTSYVGQTNHLLLRFNEHRDGKSRWTRRMKRPVCLHWEAFPTRGQAMRREKYFKQGAGFRARNQIIAESLASFA